MSFVVLRIVAMCGLFRNYQRSFGALVTVYKAVRRHILEDGNQQFNVPAFMNTKAHHSFHRRSLLDYVVSWVISSRPISIKSFLVVGSSPQVVALRFRRISTLFCWQYCKI
jgi:hypothetical protein